MKTLTKLLGFALVAYITAAVIEAAYRKGVNDAIGHTIRELLDRPDWAATVMMAGLTNQADAVKEAWEGATR